MGFQFGCLSIHFDTKIIFRFSEKYSWVSRSFEEVFERFRDVLKSCGILTYFMTSQCTMPDVIPTRPLQRFEIYTTKPTSKIPTSNATQKKEHLRELKHGGWNLFKVCFFVLFWGVQLENYFPQHTTIGPCWHSTAICYYMLLLLSNPGVPYVFPRQKKHLKVRTQP